MARKKKQEEHVNHERWLVSYADFITLLFAFFVVMYSISSVNDGKYRVLSDTLESAFNDKGKKLDPIQIGTPAKSLNPLSHIVINPEVRTNPEVVAEQKQKDNSQAALDSLNKELENKMASLIDQDMMILRRHKDALEIELKSNILFRGGRASLTIPAEKVLIRLATTLAKFPNSVQIEGHTDDQSVSSAQFPSNWELSSARASAVAYLFTEHGMDPEQMSAVGYAEYRPKVDNLSDELRSQNRRVVLMIRPIPVGGNNKDETRQAGPATLNNAAAENLQSESGELNSASQPGLEDGSAAQESFNNGAQNVAPGNTPIQLPFPARSPIVRDSPASETGR